MICGSSGPVWEASARIRSRWPRGIDILIKGGFLVFRREIFHDTLKGEGLVEKSFRRLIEDGQHLACPDDGYGRMDTFKDHPELTDTHRDGEIPWEIWKPPG